MISTTPLIASTSFSASVTPLDNGVTVVHQTVPTTSVVVVDVWVKAGAITEPQDWPGMAHFLEHMIFKGTPRVPPGLFDHIIEGRGGMTNAATSHDYAHYFIITYNQHLPDVLPYLAELLLNAAIPDDEFDRERFVVLEEIRQAYDDPDWVGLQTLNEIVYQHHPYGRSILGSETELMQRSPAEMRCFHQSRYQPDNITVVVVGGIDQEAALTLVDKSFREFADPAPCPAMPAATEPPMQGIRRQILELPRIEHARLLMGGQGPGVEQMRQACGLDLLSVILADGRSSRLVRELREDLQIVLDISCGFSLQRDSSLFTLSAWLDPDHVDQVEAIIRDRIEALSIHPASAAELQRGKRLLCNDFAFSTETSSQLAGLYGYYSTIAKPELSMTYPDQVGSFQPADLQTLAQTYISPDNYAAVVLQPT